MEHKYIMKSNILIFRITALISMFCFSAYSFAEVNAKAGGDKIVIELSDEEKQSLLHRGEPSDNTGTYVFATALVAFLAITYYAQTIAPTSHSPRKLIRGTEVRDLLSDADRILNSPTK